jgi:hypothetical protein
MTAPLVLLLAIVATMLPSEDVRPSPARWLLAGFLPVVILAKLGDGLQAADAGVDVLLRGGGRIGWGDSVNRMWVHTVPVALALLVLRFEGPSRRAPRLGQADGAVGGSDGPREWSSRRPAPVVITLALLSILVGLAATSSRWAPHYLPTLPAPIVDVVLEQPGSDPVGEMTTGSRLSQPILLPASADPRPGNVSARVCVDLRLATFDRPARGRMTVTLATAAERAEHHVRLRSIADWSERRFCLDLPPERPSLDGLTLHVDVEDARPGEGITALSGSGTSVATLTIPAIDGVSAATRTVNPLALTVTTIVQPPSPGTPVWRGTDAVVAGAPVVVALLLGLVAVGHALLPYRRRRDDGGRMRSSAGGRAARSARLAKLSAAPHRAPGAWPGA